jgi:uncharacterized protein YvpB
VWVANFVFCVLYQGCEVVTFKDQRSFATKTKCVTYTEEKSNYVIEKLEENMVIGKIYYGCEFKGTGIKA